MFQYAAGRALAAARGSRLILYVPEGIRDLLTSNFPVCARRWEDADRKGHSQLAAFLGGGLATRVRKRIERVRRVGRRHWYENDGFNHDARFMDLGDHLVLKGYWQSYKYFHHLRGQLREELRYNRPLSPAAEAMKERIEACEAAVGIHVRRGEYVTDGWPVLSNDYFVRALEVLGQRTGAPAADMFVFSDDPAWCASALLPGRPRTVVSAAGTSSFEDMVLLSRCRYLLISPSTFSWWAAYLSERARAVVAPYRWFFHDYKGFKHGDIYLPDWIVVDD